MNYPASSANPHGLLVMSDDRIIRTMLTRMLSRAGYQVLYSVSLRRGPAIYRQKFHELSAVILDFKVAGPGLRKLIETLCLTNKEVRIVLVSSAPEPPTNVDACLPDHVQFLTKPCSIDQLVERLAETISV